MHAFEPFSQENTDARTTFTGTGLGLAITKQMVELMEGTISLKSEQNVGTTISVTIPFRIDVDYTEPQEDAKPADAASLEGVHVLLVEDNELNMEIAEFLLKKAGITVTTAYNGQEAVDVFRTKAAGTFDVILMDVMMPVMDGLTAAREIHATNRVDAAEIPIFAMTANAFYDDVRQSREAGMVEHLSKPIQEQELLDAHPSACETVSAYKRKKGNSLTEGVSLFGYYQQQTARIGAITSVRAGSAFSY